MPKVDKKLMMIWESEGGTVPTDARDRDVAERPANPMHRPETPATEGW